ncbi:MAG TPA: CaiB/BaiF CoA-transferase family protein [Vineibacter sp.]|nr:CaiB/BaiF CoA-transferase family protein [Vineibacter sp.]
MASQELPLSGVRVVEFSHTVMGPTCGLVLADVGAEVIKVEPADGDRTRRLKGFGVGFFGFLNRNKRVIAVDVAAPQGRAAVDELVRRADVLIENFAPGTMAKRGYGATRCAELNPRLIYCALKGFLAGPYEHRAALDEVVQMMGGLAYMTGPRGQPLRAGASVVDIMGGTFGALGVLLKLRERERTGSGGHVESALFESVVLLMGTHLAAAAVSGQRMPPMPERLSSWAIYEAMATADGAQIFIGVTSDGQWRRFVDVFKLDALKDDPRLATNNDRIAAGTWLLPQLRRAMAQLSIAEIERLAEQADISYARVARPEDLLDDPHLAATGQLVPMAMPGGTVARLPLLPLRLDGRAMGKRHDAAAVIGQHTRPVLRELGYDDKTIDRLVADGTITTGDR